MIPESYRLIVDSHVAGIPCKLGVTEVGYYEAPYMKGHPDNWEDGINQEHAYEILDRKGYKAAWLEAKCSKQDYEQHQLDIDNHLKEFANDY